MNGTQALVYESCMQVEGFLNRHEGRIGTAHVSPVTQKELDAVKALFAYWLDREPWKAA